jgi:hypothetical protein
MRSIRSVMAVLALASATMVPAWADDRADWGIVVTVGDDLGAGLLLERNGAFTVLAMDPFTTIHRADLRPMTWTDMRPGDLIDYSVSRWAGMDIAEVLRVTPQRRSAAVSHTKEDR